MAHSRTLCRNGGVLDLLKLEHHALLRLQLASDVRKHRQCIDRYAAIVRTYPNLAGLTTKQLHNYKNQLTSLLCQVNQLSTEIKGRRDNAQSHIISIMFLVVAASIGNPRNIIRQIGLATLLRLLIPLVIGAVFKHSVDAKYQEQVKPINATEYSLVKELDSVNRLIKLSKTRVNVSTLSLMLFARQQDESNCAEHLNTKRPTH